MSSISGISGTGSTSFQELRKELEQDIASLASSLQSNDVSGAQTALYAFQQLQPGNSASGGASASDSIVTSITDDLNAIGTALSSGNLTGAQQAFSNLENLIGNQQQSSTGQTGSSSGTDAITTDFNNLSKSLQSGDLKGAQAAFKKLQSDLSAAELAQGTQQTDNASANTASTGTVSILG